MKNSNSAPLRQKYDAESRTDDDEADLSPDGDLSATEEFLQQQIIERRISGDCADRAGLKPAAAWQIRKETGVEVDSGTVAVEIPYLEEGGNAVVDPYDAGRVIRRYRLSAPHVGADGRPAKYLSRVSGGWALYEPYCLDVSSSLIVITEGEFTALIGALAKLPVVGIAGVWMFADPLVRQAEQQRARAAGTAEPRITADTALLPRLIEVCCGKCVLVLFDRDGVDKPDVRRAGETLAAAIRKQAQPTDVHFALIPPEASVKGLDDWINKTDGLDEFHNWMADQFRAPALSMSRLAQTIRTDPDWPLYAVTSEKQAEALDSGGRIPGISVVGKGPWMAVGGPLANVEGTDWCNRPVFLCPDSQSWLQLELLRPLYALAKDLEHRGAKITILKLPAGPDGQNVRFDSKWHSAHKEDLDKFVLKPASAKASVLTHAVLKPVADWWKGWIKLKPPITHHPANDSATQIVVEGMAPGFRLTKRALSRKSKAKMAQSNG